MERAKTIWQCRFARRLRSAFGWGLSTAPDLWPFKRSGEPRVVLGPARRHSDFDQRHFKHQRAAGIPRAYGPDTGLIRSAEDLWQYSHDIVARNRHPAGSDLDQWPLATLGQS